MREKYVSNQEALILSASGGGVSQASYRHPNTNEDDFLVDDWNQVYAVFDGLGGHEGSEVASHTAEDVVFNYFKNKVSKRISEADAHTSMAAVLARAHRAILTINDANHGGIATTAAVISFFETPKHQPKVAIGHIGDSRVYLQRKDWKLYPLTIDHGVNFGRVDDEQRLADQYALAEFLDRSELNDNQISQFQRRHVVGAALGLGDLPMPRSSVQVMDVRPEDRFILTTDGVHDNLTTAEMDMALRGQSDPGRAAEELVRASYSRSLYGQHLRSKPDDITVVVADVPKLS